MQTGIALGDLILGCGAIRDDGASKAYVYPEYPAVADYQLLGLCVEAAKALGCPYHVGIIHSHESFYHEENDAESAYWSRKGRAGRGYGIRSAVYHRPSARDEDSFHSQ